MCEINVNEIVGKYTLEVIHRYRGFDVRAENGLYKASNGGYVCSAVSLKKIEKKINDYYKQLKRQF